MNHSLSRGTVVAVSLLSFSSLWACGSSSKGGSGVGGGTTSSHSSSSSSTGTGGGSSSSSSSSASSTSSGAVPTDCTQADNDVGCCTSAGVVYFCQNGALQPPMTCPTGQVCGWNAGMGFYDCVPAPGGADPSHMYPLLCGGSGSSSSSSTSTGGTPGACKVTCNNHAPNHETGCDACIMKVCQPQLTACLNNKGSGCLGCADVYNGGSGINCSQTDTLLSALFGCVCKPTACD